MKGYSGLQIVNEGRGFACDIEVELNIDDKNVSLMTVPVISSNGSITRIKYVDENEGILNNENKGSLIKISVKYKDIENGNYLAQFESDPETSGGFKILFQDRIK